MKYKNNEKITDAFEITQEYFDSLWSYDKQKHGDKKVPMYRKEINHRMYLEVHGNKADLFIETESGVKKAEVGDWILTEEDGDKELVKKNKFEAEYSKV